MVGWDIVSPMSARDESPSRGGAFGSGERWSGPNRAFFVALLLLAALLVGALLWVFLPAIVLSLVLVTLFGGPTDRLERALGGRRRLAAGLVTAAIGAGIVGPLTLFLVALSGEVLSIAEHWRELPLGAALFSALHGEGAAAAWVVRLLARFGVAVQPMDISAYLASAIREASGGLYALLGGLAANVAQLFVQLCVMLVITFALFTDGARLKRFLMGLSPLPEEIELELIGRFRAIVRAVFYGNGLGSLLQGVIGGIGFTLFGVGSGILWGSLMGVLATLPVFGASVIFLPASLLLWLNGEAGKALAFFAYNVTQVVLLEYWLKPRLIGAQSKMNSVLVFLSILGGISLFGILGLFYGPLFVAVFLALVGIYRGGRGVRDG